MKSTFVGELDGLSDRAKGERRKHVARLANWMMADSDNVVPRPLARVPGEVVSQTTLKKYFSRQRTYGDPWGGLCHAVHEHLSENLPDADPPLMVVAYAEAYRKNREARGAAASRVAHPSYRQDQFLSWTQAELLKAVDAKELGLAVAAARFVVGKHFAAMKIPGASAFGTAEHKDERTASQKALGSANEIIDMAESILDRVSARDANPTDLILKDCVHIFESAADARRLRSRDPEREQSELYELVRLRRAELKLTKRVRTAVDLIFARYHCNAVDALLRNRALEVAAVDKLFTELNTLVHGSGGAAHRKELKTDALLAAVARVASYSVSYPEYFQILQQCAEKAEKLLPSRRTENHEIRTLLNQAGLLGDRIEVPTPTQLLQLARFRGVGELLLARALVRIGTAQTIIEGLDKYLGENLANPSPVRAKILQRAVVYYERSSAWLRQAGAAGEIKKAAISECSSLKISLREMDREEHPLGPDSKKADELVRKIHDQIDIIIADSIIRTDFTQPLGFGSYRVAVELKWTLMQVLRVLDEPFTASLRTDMPPIDFESSVNRNMYDR